MSAEQLWELTDNSWREFPIEDEYPSHSIIRAIGEVTEQDVTSIRPLNDIVNPEAIDNLCEDTSVRSVRIEMVYEGCQVAVTSDSIYLRELTT